MAKIHDQGEGKGKYWATKDVVGVPLEIVEECDRDTDFRIAEKKEGSQADYMCMRCTDGMETKDLHATNNAMLVISKVLGKGSWKGQQFVINSMTGGQYSTVAKVTRLSGGMSLVKDQSTLSDPPGKKEEFPQSPETTPQKIQRFLKGLPAEGFPEQKTIEIMTVLFGDQALANTVFGSLKQTGYIYQKVDGNWCRT